MDDEINREIDGEKIFEKKGSSLCLVLIGRGGVYIFSMADADEAGFK
jgi:hypothetical protein